MKTAEAIRKDLAYCDCADCYYRFARNCDFYITSGVKNMIELCKAVWLVTDIFLLSRQEQIRQEGFVVYNLTLSGRSAVLTADDGNNNELARERIPYTDFPLPEGIKLYQCDNILMLASEY